MTCGERDCGRNFRKTFELIELAKALRVAAIRKKFPEMIGREVRMIKDAVLDDEMTKHSSEKEIR